jgi:hypothetical protein
MKMAAGVGADEPVTIGGMIFLIARAGVKDSPISRNAQIREVLSWITISERSWRKTG